MALATLQGATVRVENSTYSLSLSHSPTLQRNLPQNSPYPQFIEGEADGHHLLHNASPQDIFKWFRHAGPLMSVNAGVRVGRNLTTCVIQYWDAVQAEYAERNCCTMNPELDNMAPFTLRTYDPCKLLCSVRSFIPIYVFERHTDFASIRM